MYKNLSPYLILNICFFMIIISVFVYSYVFTPEKNNYPIPSFYTEKTGKKSISTGLSRAFSSIVHLDFEKAKGYNPRSIRLFSFFLVQFFMRIIGSFLFFKIKKISTQIIYVDISLTIVLFLWSFYDFFFFWQNLE